jgi:lysophospholipase L1-like esterase
MPGRRACGKEMVARLLGIFVLGVLLTGMTACSSRIENGEQGESHRPGRTYGQTTGTSERDTGATSPDAPTTWDYVALGDSLAAGVGARRGYVDRYAEDLRDNTGARVRVTDLGVSGQTSPQLLHSLRKDPSTRRALRGAEVVTFNIGINDLGQAHRSYETGSCGGARNERCLRAAVETLEGNWDAITEEILGLRPADETIIRTVGLGYTPRAEGTFEPYLSEVNRHIVSSAADNGIPYAEVRLHEKEMSWDGVHPNDMGYEVIAERLRELGYQPLGPREP